MKVVEIVPAEGGWMVRSDAVENEMFFKSGASAESAAIRLAQGIADAGEHTRVEIYVRDGSLARRFTVPSITRLGGLSPALQPA